MVSIATKVSFAVKHAVTTRESPGLIVAGSGGTTLVILKPVLPFFKLAEVKVKLLAPGFPLFLKTYVLQESYPGAVESSVSRKYLPLSGVKLTADRKSTRLNSSHGYISYAVF